MRWRSAAEAGRRTVHVVAQVLFASLNLAGHVGDDPAADPAIYQKTSPMTYIKQARTPTLIQHGELDKRVPIANGYELRQGLEPGPPRPGARGPANRRRR